MAETGACAFAGPSGSVARADLGARGTWTSNKPVVGRAGKDSQHTPGARPTKVGVGTKGEHIRIGMAVVATWEERTNADGDTVQLLQWRA